MNWFEKHLNWAWFFWFILIAFAVNSLIPYERIWIIPLPSYIGILIILPMSAWVLH